MRRLLVLVVAVLPAASAVAKEVFDIARFGTPPRWQRSTSPGLLTLQAPPARGSSAQIFLFASEPTRGSPEENFRLAWQKLIAAPLGGLAPASTSAETTPDGWTAVSGASPYVRQGATWRALLITATGHGRVMSMVAQVLGTGHDREIETFFKELDLVAGPESPAAASAAPPAGGAVAPPAPGPGESGVELTPPRGWSRSPRAEALTYVSPPYPNTGEVCQLVVLPMRRGGGDLLREAVGTFQGLFRTDPMRGYPEIEPLLVRGTSPLGWPYVTVHKTLGRGGEETGAVILLVAGVGDQVATVFTVSKPPLVSQCFGEAFPSEWPAIFHSLRLKGSAPRTGEAELK